MTLVTHAVTTTAAVCQMESHPAVVFEGLLSEPVPRALSLGLFIHTRMSAYYTHAHTQHRHSIHLQAASAPRLTSAAALSAALSSSSN